MTTTTYRQNGCNRGGSEHVVQLANKLPPSLPTQPLFELVDPEQGRAEALAPVIASHRFPVRVSEEAAPLARNATVDVYAVDDVRVPARALEGRPTTSVIEVALLVSVPTIEAAGGVVTAIAATATPNSVPVRDALRLLLRQIEEIAPGRHSSAGMAALGVHAEQMPRARHAAHDRLTTQSASFLTYGEVEPEIVLIDGFTGITYQVEVVEARRDDRRRRLKQATLSELLPGVTEDGNRRGIVFYDRQDPWLYVALARRGAYRWHLDRAFELPVVRMMPGEEPVEALTFVTD